MSCHVSCSIFSVDGTCTIRHVPYYYFQTWKAVVCSVMPLVLFSTWTTHIQFVVFFCIVFKRRRHMYDLSRSFVFFFSMDGTCTIH